MNEPCKCKHDARSHTFPTGDSLVLGACSRCACAKWYPAWHDQMKGDLWRHDGD